MPDAVADGEGNDLMAEKKDTSVDYEQAMRSFEEKRFGPGRTKERKLRHTVTPDGGVDYLDVSKAYEHILQKDKSEVIRTKEN